MRWTLCKFSPPGGDIYEQDWLFDGEQLCRLPLREFELRLHHDAEIIYAELELWKSGIEKYNMKTFQNVNDAFLYQLKQLMDGSNNKTIINFFSIQHFLIKIFV